MDLGTARTSFRKPTRCPKCSLPIRAAVAFVADASVTVRYEHSNGETACVVSRPITD
jgi:hypothetical protein